MAVVALRKESVDRNSNPTTMRSVIGVALRKESVDRNAVTLNDAAGDRASLSARRAWIEILPGTRRGHPGQRRSPQGERG